MASAPSAWDTARCEFRLCRYRVEIVAAADRQRWLARLADRPVFSREPRVFLPGPDTPEMPSWRWRPGSRSAADAPQTHRPGRRCCRSIPAIPRRALADSYDKRLAVGRFFDLAYRLPGAIAVPLTREAARRIGAIFDKARPVAQICRTTWCDAADKRYCPGNSSLSS